MKKIIAIMMVLVLASATVAAYEKVGDSVVYSSTYADLTVTPHTSKSPRGDHTQTFRVESKSSPGHLCVAYRFNNPLRKTDLCVWKNTTEYVDSPVYCENETINGTVRYQCGTEQVERTREICEDKTEYMDFFHGANGYTYYSTTPLYFDAWDSHKWTVEYEINGSGKWDLIVWNTPNLDCGGDYLNQNYNFRYVLDPWYSHDYMYKRVINCSKMSDKVPLVVNGSGGFTINGHNQVVWTYCSGSGTALYYNNHTDYVIANDTNRLPFKVESGTASGYDSVNVWDSDHEAVFLMNNYSDATVNNNDLGVGDNAPSQISELNTIDGAYEFDGDDSLEDGDAGIDMSGYTATVCCYANFTYTSDKMTLVKIGEGYKLGIFIHANSDGPEGSIEFHTRGTIGDADKIHTDTTWADGDMHLFCGVKNGTGAENLSIYVDGVKENTIISKNSGSNLYNDCDVQIGKNVDKNYWQGLIDYNFLAYRPYTSEEIEQTYKNIKHTSGFGDVALALETNIAPSLENPAPPDNITGVSITPTLNITYYDNDSDLGNVSFVNATNNEVWCSNLSVANGTRLHCSIETLGYGATVDWYANATDGVNVVTTATWNFTTETTTTTTTTTTTDSTTTTIPCDYRNLTYHGNKKLCITNTTGGETCLTQNEKTEYDCRKDYYLTIKEIQKEKSFSNATDFFTNNLIRWIMTLVFILLIGYVTKTLMFR